MTLCSTRGRSARSRGPRTTTSPRRRRSSSPTPPLTAPIALDLADVAGILGEVHGRTIERVVVDDDEWAAGLVGQGVPADRAAMLLGMFRAARRGEFATTDPTLEELIGRPATPILQGR
ncbi:hypothetical protein [Actinophytocola gossypii]|uniref:Uncharacterized protein n=1 Tax=Actinophytocola gossypii TaxID=2812003 RepID=A0ABT2JDA9_9PSEU|nr:hypothetical protein [Actinophytocola gossypii]MCT2585857.1 hypothetical protein [Actinophytocola gossypii]